MTSSTLGRYDASPEPRERPSIARRPRPAITSTTNRAKCFSGSHSSTEGGIRKPVSRSTGRKFFMREKSGEQRKRISVSGFYPRSIRGVKSDRLLEPFRSHLLSATALALCFCEHLHPFTCSDANAICSNTTAGLYAACVVFVGANGRAGRVADVSVARLPSAGRCAAAVTSG